MPTYQPEYLEILIYVAEELGLPLEDVITMWGKAQPSNLYDQMMNGVRFIDLRCGWLEHKKEWVTFHWETGNTIQQLMDDVAAFLKSHPQEILLIEASHLEGHNVNDDALTKLVDIFQNTLGNTSGIGLFPRIKDDHPYYLPTYGEMVSGGYRVFLSLENDDFARKYDNIQFKGVFENSYADSDNVTFMMEFNDQQIGKYNANETSQDALFKISWTLTPNGNSITKGLLPKEPHTLLELGALADKYMLDWVKNQLIEGMQIGNVFIYDNYREVPIAEVLDEMY